MGGPNQYGGLPPGLKRQAAEAVWADNHVDRRMPVPVDDDPQVVAMARTIACAIRDSRPVVTLPPHIFIPWKAKPWFVETRWILNGSTVASVDSGASAAASAEGISVVSESTEYTTVGSAGSGVISGTYTVPKGYVAILRQWAAQCDDGGYFQDSSTGQPFVKFILVFDGNEPTILSPGLLGNDGDLDHPFDVSYIIPENHTVAVLAKSTDQNAWHLIETFMKGYLIEAQDVNDTFGAISNRGPC
jgi:hypothetical protein